MCLSSLLVVDFQNLIIRFDIDIEFASLGQEVKISRQKELLVSVWWQQSTRHFATWISISAPDFIADGVAWLDQLLILHQNEVHNLATVPEEHYGFTNLGDQLCPQQFQWRSSVTMLHRPSAWKTGKSLREENSWPSARGFSMDFEAIRLRLSCEL